MIPTLPLSRYAAIAALFAFTTVLAAQSAPTPPASPKSPPAPFSDVQRGYASLKTNILKSADLMPSADYTFRATPEVRTYARVVNHITEAQIRACGAINGTAPDALAKVPSDTADKATIVAGLQASFAECDKAYASLTETNLLQMIPIGPATRARIGIAWGNVSHENEQYATLALYLRLKGIVPPSSEK